MSDIDFLSSIHLKYKQAMSVSLQKAKMSDIFKEKQKLIKKSNSIKSKKEALQITDYYNPEFYQLQEIDDLVISNARLVVFMSSRFQLFLQTTNQPNFNNFLASLQTIAQTLQTSQSNLHAYVLPAKQKPLQTQSELLNKDDDMNYFCVKSLPFNNTVQKYNSLMEIDVMQKINNIDSSDDNFQQLLAVFIERPAQNENNTDNNTTINLLMDFSASSLQSAIDNQKVFSEQEIIKLFSDICRMNILLHKNDLVHMDIKPASFLYKIGYPTKQSQSENQKEIGRYVLSDFQECTLIDNCNMPCQDTVARGVPAFMSPQVFASYCKHKHHNDEQIQKYYTPAYDPTLSDLYSVGLVMLNAMGVSIKDFLILRVASNIERQAIIMQLMSKNKKTNQNSDYQMLIQQTRIFQTVLRNEEYEREGFESILKQLIAIQMPSNKINSLINKHSFEKELEQSQKEFQIHLQMFNANQKSKQKYGHCLQNCELMLQCARGPAQESLANHLMAETLNKMHSPYQALQFAQKAFYLDQTIYGPRSAQIADDLNLLGLIKEGMGQYQFAVKNLQDALGINMDVFGECHERVFILANNIALIFKKMGDFELAEQYFSRQLLIAQKSEKKMKEALACNSVGGLYLESGQPTKALQSFENALICISQHNESMAQQAMHQINPLESLEIEAHILLGKACALKMLEMLEGLNGIYDKVIKILKAFTQNNLAAYAEKMLIKLDEQIKSNKEIEIEKTQMQINFAQCKKQEQLFYLEIALDEYEQMNNISRIAYLKQKYKDDDYIQLNFGQNGWILQLAKSD